MDMSTGLTSVNRGFDFSTEEHGVAIERMQSHLSDHHTNRGLSFKRRKRDGSRLKHSLVPRSLRRKQPAPLESDQTPLN